MVQCNLGRLGSNFGGGIEGGWLKEWASHMPTKVWTSWAIVIDQAVIDHIANKKICHKLSLSLWQQKNSSFWEVFTNTMFLSKIED
jgi:hypothetical protein